MVKEIIFGGGGAEPLFNGMVYPRFKTCMQVEGDVKCMQTNFGGHGFSGFGGFATFCLPLKMAQISLSIKN